MFFFNQDKKFWDNFLDNYSKLIYFNIRQTFNEYNFNYTNENTKECFNDVIVKIFSQKNNIIKNYKEEKSKFSTYLSVICCNRTIDYLNDNKYIYSHSNSEIEDIYIENEDNEIKLSIDKILNVNYLSDREKLILKLFYLKELKSNEIADILHISNSTVRVLKKQAIEKLQKEML